MTPAQATKLTTWRELQIQAAAACEAEMKLRREIVAEMFDADKLEGTETVTLSNGWKLKADKKLYYNVTQGEPLDDLENFCEKVKGMPFFEELLRWKAELSLTTYKKSLPLFRAMLPDARQKQLDKLIAEAVTTKPGAPSLELVPPIEKQKTA